jgi:hypothetical protein
MSKKTNLWKLKDIVQDIAARHSSITEIYLFGSRAYKTGSRRSDIDLLAVCPSGLATRDCNEWLHEKYPPIDLFKTSDMKVAESVINGSIIRRRGEPSLHEQLQAIMLWSQEKGFNENFQDWDQITDQHISFEMTIAEPYLPSDFPEAIKSYGRILKENGYPNTFLGNDWPSIGASLCEVIQQSLNVPTHLNHRAEGFARKCLQLRTEYDFQNLIHLVVRAWIPTLEPEGVMVRFDGQEKRSDFYVPESGIIIEAKHVKDASTQAAVIKTLEGLKNFYKANPSARLLVFLILTEANVEMDAKKVEAMFSDTTRQPAVIVKVLRNTLALSH